jgi:NADH dehydrogenase [ubiquinone] 1 alpha subcomplex assembly factor 7
MSERARAAIDAAIRDHGPIAWSEYMDLALYGPGGFYERPPVGTGPDTAFATSPHVHPVFAHLLSAALLELWDGLGRPEPLRIVEAGAGDGTLARQLMDAFAAVPVEYSALERSPGARAALEAIDGVHVIDALPVEAHVVVANELLDNLPFDRIVGGDQIRVGSDGGGLAEVRGDDGSETIEPVGALAWIDDLAGSLERGYTVLIDYGELGGPGGPSHGYRAHRVIEDLLADPGSADITAGVDFRLIAQRAEAAGLVAFPPVTQHEALLALGFESWSGRSRATLLVEPAALGRLRWLLLASAGLPEPSWLSTARETGDDRVRLSRRP